MGVLGGYLYWKVVFEFWFGHPKCPFRYPQNSQKHPFWAFWGYRKWHLGFPNQNSKTTFHTVRREKRRSSVDLKVIASCSIFPNYVLTRLSAPQCKWQNRPLCLSTMGEWIADCSKLGCWLKSPRTTIFNKTSSKFRKYIFCALLQAVFCVYVQLTSWMSSFSSMDLS